jgi:hypothetical protein
MHFGSYFFLQKWLLGLLHEDVAEFGEAKLVTGIIALAIYDYMSSPYGVEGRNAAIFLESEGYGYYCDMVGLNGQYVLDMMGRLEYDEETDTIRNQHSGGLWQA